MSTPQGALLCSDEYLPITKVTSADPFAQLYIEIQSSLLSLTDDNYSEEQQKILANFNKIINYPNPPSPKEANEQFVFMLLARIYFSHYHKRSLYDRIAKLLNPNKDKFEKAINIVREEKKELEVFDVTGYYRARQIIYENASPNPIEQLIMDDELQALQEKVRKEVKFESTIPDIVAALKLAAICGSVQCFKYLWLNHENDETHYGLFDAAIFGGNYEIIHFLENNGYEEFKNLPSTINTAVIAHRNEIAHWLFMENRKNFGIHTALNEYNLQATIWADRKLKEIDSKSILLVANIPIISHLHLAPHNIDFSPHGMNMLFSTAGVEAAASIIKFYNIQYDPIDTMYLVLSDSLEPIQFIDWVFEQKFDVFFIKRFGTMFTCIAENCSGKVMAHFLNLLKNDNTDEAKIRSYLNDIIHLKSPLMLAAKKEDMDMIDVLIKNGADVNATDFRYSFLFNLLDSHPERSNFALELLQKYHKTENLISSSSTSRTSKSISVAPISRKNSTRLIRQETRL